MVSQALKEIEDQQQDDIVPVEACSGTAEGDSGVDSTVTTPAPEAVVTTDIEDMVVEETQVGIMIVKVSYLRQGEAEKDLCKMDGPSSVVVFNPSERRR